MEEEQHDARHGLIESMLWDIAARALVLGVIVILDFGSWAKVEREDYRGRAKQLGAGSEIHFMDVPEAELRERLATRNAHLPPGVTYIPEAKLREALAIFQPPEPDELTRGRKQSAGEARWVTGLVSGWVVRILIVAKR